MQEKLFQPIQEIRLTENPPTPMLQKTTEPLIKLDKQHPRIFCEPVYYQQQIASSLQAIYLRQEVYERLQKAISLLPENYSFILYDGYRPLQVQQYLFTHFAEKMKNQHPNLTEDAVFKETVKFVAFPKEGQEHLVPHVTGGAIDLTLGDVAGHALDLGTAFDEMTEKSATRYFEQHPDENKKACDHRRLLYHCMTTVGFTNYAEEWWHYDFHNMAWARRVKCKKASYGAICAKIDDNLIKEYRYL